MTRTVLLLRHAKSRWDDATLDDFDRALAPRGRQAAPRMARHLRQAGLKPDLVLCSAAVRAVETWRLVAEAIGRKAVVKELRGLYLAPPSRILSAIQHAPPSAGTVLVVGHNPGLEHLAERLAGPDSRPKPLERMRAKFPTAAVAVFRFDTDRWTDVRPGDGRLDAFVRPKDLDD